jgi:Fe-S cluster biogenesis protein NfuA
VQEKLDQVVRDVLAPLFEADGASVEVVESKGGVVRVRFGGAYRGCPSAPFTFEGVVVPAFRHALGDVRVELVP